MYFARSLDPTYPYLYKRFQLNQAFTSLLLNNRNIQIPPLKFINQSRGTYSNNRKKEIAEGAVSIQWGRDPVSSQCAAGGFVSVQSNFFFLLLLLALSDTSGASYE